MEMEDMISSIKDKKQKENKQNSNSNNEQFYPLKINKYEGEVGNLEFDKKESIQISKCFGPFKYNINVGPPPFCIFNGGIDNPARIIQDNQFKGKKLRIIYNPTSGGGHCQKIILQVEKQLKLLNTNYELIQSKSIEHLQQIVQEYDQNKSDYLLTICGGDGSIYLAVNAYVKIRDQTGKPLQIAILPGGTGNALCKQFDIEPDNQQFQLQRLIQKPTIRSIDTLKTKITNSKGEVVIVYGAILVGLGLSGRIVSRAKGRLYNFFFKANYTIAAICEILKNQAYYFQIELDNQLLDDNIMCKYLVVANIQMTGYNIRTHPYAQIDDGLMDLVLICGNTLSEFQSDIGQSQTGQSIYSPFCKYYRCRSCKISTTNKQDIHLTVDGELFIASIVELEIDQNLLRIVY